MAFDQEVVYQLKQKSSSTEGFLLREVNGSSSCAKYRGGEGGTFKASPQGPTPHSQYINYFSQRRHPFQLKNGTPASFANCCKCTIFYGRICH